MQTNSLKTKFFIGFPLTIDQKMQLNQKKEWKQASIVKENVTLVVEKFHKAEYIGEYQEHSMLTLNEIRNHVKRIGERLHAFLPEFDSDPKRATVFSQVFVS